ncbi:SRPBCC domain-containing protein [Brachybacterium vulturis]|uniref:SRPBCC domain-containing protein n=1 Tax=Brachybacterium vulturis TaxID=2017484 RepID=UPI003735D34F
MTITGSLDATGRELALTRTVPAPARSLWEHLSRSSLLATWYGTFTGDPATGAVQVTMTAEPGQAVAAEFTIHACEPERLLTVSSSMGEDTWRLSLELEPVTGTGTDTDVDTDGHEATRIVLRHHDVPREMLAYVGPGWEWYLDRLTGAVTGGDIPGMDVWDSQYMSLSEAYAALAQ